MWAAHLLVSSEWRFYDRANECVWAAHLPDLEHLQRLQMCAPVFGGHGVTPSPTPYTTPSAAATPGTLAPMASRIAARRPLAKEVASAASRRPRAWSLCSALADRTFMAHPAKCLCPQSCYARTCPRPTTLEGYGPLREDLSEAELTVRLPCVLSHSAAYGRAPESINSTPTVSSIVCILPLYDVH